jgi:4-amino-4-deoxy-L-arabinose transferase-like glycosyltransferase
MSHPISRDIAREVIQSRQSAGPIPIEAESRLAVSLRLRQGLLAGILVVNFALTVLYAFLTPPWEAPDEPAHYLYVAQLATAWHPPIKPNVAQTTNFYKDQPFISSNYEWYQPAVGYLPQAVGYALLRTWFPSSLPAEIPPLSHLAGIDSAHPARLFFQPSSNPLEPWKAGWGLLALRLVTSLGGLVVVYATYRIGNLLDPQSGLLGLAAAGWLAFLPQFTFTSASVRSDMMANAMATLLLLLGAVIQKAALSNRTDSVLMGVLLGLGILTKGTFLYLVPLAVVAVLFRAPRSGRAWATSLLYLMGPALLIVATYYLAFDEARAALAYNATVLRPKAAFLSWDYLTQIPKPLLFDLFFASFGWANIAPSPNWSMLALAIWGVGACLSVVQAIRLFRRQGLTESVRIILLLGLLMILALCGAFYYNLAFAQPQGRFLFPALAAWAVFAFWGMWQMPFLRGRVLIAFGCVAFMLAFNLYGLSILFQAYY